ncbi:4'-phosphopantetheinyl transferase superfamily protein [soil metagenome]
MNYKIALEYHTNLMPLLKISSLGEEKAWGLWHIRESEEALSFGSMESCPEEIVNTQKRLEWLAGRNLIKSLAENLGLLYHGIKKDEYGKPFLNEHQHHISLSHSYPYVAAQIDRLNPVGIDLEQPKDKLRRIAYRVFNKNEIADAGDNFTKLCIYWCGKESLYKIYGKKNLHFIENLLITPFTLAKAGSLTGTIRLSDHETLVMLQYLVTEDFVMVYTDTTN